MNEKSIFAERLKEARLKADLSQAELSRRTKISAATLSTYESTDNPKSPPIDKAATIARELNVSLDWLCGLDTGEKSSDEKEQMNIDDILNAVITLSKLNSTMIDIEHPAFDTGKLYANICICDQVLCEFAEEYQKIADFMKNPDYPEYLKNGLKETLMNKFTSKYCVNNGQILDIAPPDAPF